MPSRYDIAAADIRRRLTDRELIQLTNEASALEVNWTVVEEAIEDEELDLEGYAGVFYQLPVRLADGSVPGDVRGKVLDGVKLRLWGRKSSFIAENGDLATVYKREATTLLDWKKGLADPRRLVKIPGAVESGELAGSGGADALMTSEALVFTRESMEGW